MVAGFINVWTEVVTFFVSLFTDATTIFVTVGEGGVVTFTFLGVMALVMSGVSLILTAFSIIRSFLPMRG